MKKPLTHALLLAAAIFCFSAAESVRAQSTPSSPKCVIKKITPELFRSPDKGYKKAAPGQPPQWLEIDVDFDMPQDDSSGPKFCDDLTVNYYILLNNKGITEDGKATLLTGSVSHADFAYGKGLHVGAFVSPHTLSKFFDGKVPHSVGQIVQDIGVTISDSSGVIASKSDKGDAGWWENTEKYTEITGRVLAKDNTPFAHLSWDYYLPTKPKSGL
jgi:hypothetical protein